MFSKLLGRIVLRARSDTSKEIEILVLRVGARNLGGPVLITGALQLYQVVKGRGTAQQVQF